MREIKFRGKRIDNGEWVYGSLRVEGEKAYILTSDYSVVIDEPRSPALDCGVEDRGYRNDGYSAAWYGWDTCIETYQDYFPQWSEVDPATIGQYIDRKEKNGKEIYEGDILAIKFFPRYCERICWSGPPDAVASVFWDLDSFRLKAFGEEDARYADFCDICYQETSTIGNIHDNPALIGKHGHTAG